MSSTQNDIELVIWKEIASENLSVSHDRWHIDRVLSFAYQLHSIYGGDKDVITAAVILHDLGRSDPSLHGRESIDKSLVHSREILQSIRFPEEKVNQVLLAIQEHDDHTIKPSTLEGRILKDADFLAGFGAWGVLRIAMWAGETGEGVDQVYDRLLDRMMKRFNSLEYPESEAWAINEVAFVNLFLSLLKDPPQLLQVKHPGKYIVLEGISGSGKDTQADILQARMEKQGYSVVRVDEPADEYRKFRKLWKARHKNNSVDPLINAFFFMADRYEQIQARVRPALESNKVVISVRSFVSTLVYQCNNEQEVAAAAFAHQFVPVADLLILYDLDTQTAFERIKGRKTAGVFEKRELLDLHRQRYLSIFGSGIFGKRARVIDTSQPIDAVAEETWEVVLSSVLKRS